MKQRSKAPFSALAISLLTLASAGCSRHHDRHVVVPVQTAPSFFEVEPNDDDFNANDMGILLPGDLFYIEGSITDSGFDPFDGFLFTSGAPVHVDFRLFIDNQLADFDVCLYDPEFDEILACYETSGNPELGGVDVFTDFTDFHLVINSFVGSGTYALEIDVQPLYLREASAVSSAGLNGRIAPSFENPAAQAEADLGIRSARGAEGFAAYRSQREPQVSVTKFELDAESGALTETVTLQSGK